MLDWRSYSLPKLIDVGLKIKAVQEAIHEVTK